MKLNPLKFGLAFGIIYALVFFLMGLAGALFGWGREMLERVGDFYVGFGPSASGAVVGGVWGLAIGLVFFGLGAWIYNRLLG